MNSNVYIKSYSNGLKVFLNSECSFEEIADEVRNKFSESKGFFMGGKIAISFEGRKLSHEEEINLVKIMEDAADMRILYIISKDDESDENFLKAVMRPVPGPLDDSVFAKFSFGNVKKRDRIECDNGLIIIGDVEPGAVVTAKGSIIVIGGIYGSVSVIESDSDNKAFIACFDASPEKIEINGIEYSQKEASHWLIKPKMNSKVFFLEDASVKMELINKDTLNKLYKSLY